EADELVAVLGDALADHRADHRVEAGTVTTAGEDAAAHVLTSGNDCGGVRVGSRHDAAAGCPPMTRVIGLTGVTGVLGGRVAERVAAGLDAADARLRLVVRDASRAPALPGAEVSTFPGG